MKLFSMLMALVLLALPMQHTWAKDEPCPIGLVPNQKGPDKETDFVCTRQQIYFACEKMYPTDDEERQTKKIACEMRKYNEIKQKIEKLIAGELTINIDKDTCDDLKISIRRTTKIALDIERKYSKFLRPDIDTGTWIREGYNLIENELLKKECPLPY